MTFLDGKRDKSDSSSCAMPASDSHQQQHKRQNNNNNETNTDGRLTSPPSAPSAAAGASDGASASGLRRNVSAPAVADSRLLGNGGPWPEWGSVGRGQGSGAGGGCKRSSDMLARYQSKVRESKRALLRMRLQKDAQLESIKLQLFLLESQLRKEQKEILGKLDQRDVTIASQQQEITKLRRDNRRLLNRLKKLSEDQEGQQPLGDLHHHHYPTTSTCSSSELSDASLYGTIGPHSAAGSYRLLGASGRADSAPSLRDILHSTTKCNTFNNSLNSSRSVNSHHHHPHNPNLSLRVKDQKSMSITNSLTNCSSKSMEAVNPNVASVRAMTDRVLHKPPIAEKPKVCTAGRVQTSSRAPPSQPAPSSCSSSSSRNSRQCTIVSTISRLLEEESDGTGAGSSGSSEPSSPEATLKPQTPRVIRLARQYDGIVSNKHHHHQHHHLFSESSPESLRNHERVIKSLLMDECEVTSGYNSDAISDHDYENVRLISDSLTSSSSSNTRPEARSGGGDEDDEEGYVEEDDNYVVLEAAVKKDVHNDTSVWEVSEADDHPIYSNVQYSSTGNINSLTTAMESSGRGVSASGANDLSNAPPSVGRRQQVPVPSASPRAVGRAKSLDDLLETNLDTSSLRPGSAPTSPTKPSGGGQGGHTRGGGHSSSTGALHLPRCRHNISNLILEPQQPDHMADNFEEFTLDSLELEEDQEHGSSSLDSSGSSGGGRHHHGKGESITWGGVGRRGKENLLPSYELRRCGDGAEMKTDGAPSVPPAGGAPGEVCAVCSAAPGSGPPASATGHSYEKFLEATGLSQKSILTPSRVFSNHRSVLKPRDIKHRDKLRAAFTTLATLEEAPSPTPQSSRYWTEPYL